VSDSTDPQPVDVVVISHFFPAHGGGIELVASRLVNEYLKSGLRVEWYASATDPPPAPRPALLSRPVQASNIVESVTQLPYPLWTPASIPKLWRSIGLARAVHVHEHLYVGSILGILMARLRSKRVVITQHMGALKLGTAAASTVYRIGVRALAWPLMSAASHVAFVSANVLEFFGESKARSPGTRTLVFNGLDNGVFNAGGVGQRRIDRAELGLSADQLTVMFSGRFVRKKGLRLLRDLARTMPDVTWLFAGAGPEDPATWQLPNVRQMGRLDQRALARAYRASDVLVLPSTGEGFPLVVQEALACGAVVLSTGEVASACPDAVDLIHVASYEGLEGDLACWERRLREILGSEIDAGRRHERAARASELWSWERCAATYIHLLGITTAIEQS
jgi:glycosyltransferase involved in cell wall biosynthesis